MLLFNSNNNKLQNKKKQKFSPVKNFFIDLLFPKHCISCNREGTFLCQDCFSLIEPNPFQYCLCSKPQRVIEKGKCGRCRDRRLSGLYSAADFKQEILKNCIHKFKYGPYIKDLSYPLSYLIILHFEALKKKLPAGSVLIPVPLFSKKERERGFNQSEEISKILSRAWQIELISGNLLKTKNTPAQAGLGKEKRGENLLGAFRLKNESAVKERIIYLVDDVYTTGATMEECARTLKEAGAKQVWGITVARELGF
jgi:ComF family protein